jgi:hypothetical protein
MTAFQPEKILATLAHHGVEYVLIGGFAAQLHGSGLPTLDVDVSPEMSVGNLLRLIDALTQMNARIRVHGDEGLPFRTSPEALRGTRLLNLVTDYGDLDLVIEPQGTGGFPHLARGASERVLAGISVRVASLSDVITSKEAAGRPKDVRALPHLERLRGEQQGTTSPPSGS